MTTDELIAKYTTNKEEDLAKLREYFVGKTFSEVIENEFDENEEWIGSYYKNTSVIPDASTSIEDVVVLFDKYPFIKYNNRRYLLGITEGGEESVVNSVEDVTELTCVIGTLDEIIIFAPKTNQTWYEWATDETDSNDLIMANWSNLSLKDVIKNRYQNYGEESYINYFDSTAGWSGSSYDLYLWDSLVDNIQGPKCNSRIIAGGIYYIQALT